MKDLPSVETASPVAWSGGLRSWRAVRGRRGAKAAFWSTGLPLPTPLFTALVSVGLCGLVGFYAATNRPDSTDRLLVCALLLVPALMLAWARSTFLLDYLLIIVVVNRELRRLLDWGQWKYDSTSVLSLLPILTAGLMVITVMTEWRKVPPAMRTASKFLVAAMVYGLGLGLIGYGLPALYACAEYVTPLLVLYYCVASRPSAAVMRRWVTVLATLGVLAGAYGIYQWIDPPPWDAAWVMWSGMWSSMGAARPYELSICSTLESRGPAAMFFAVVTAAMVALPALRRGGGVLLAAIPATALLLTQARTGLIYLVLTLLASTVFARRRGGGIKIVLGLVIAAGVTVFFLGREEHSSVIFDRVGTLGMLENDGSTMGRMDIAQHGAQTVLSSPQGLGFGSGGNATKVGDKPDEQDAISDNGYLEILSTLGVPGTLLYGIGIALIIRLIVRNSFLFTFREPATQLGLGMLVALAPALLVYNHLMTVHASYVWILLSRHLAGPRLAPGPVSGSYDRRNAGYNASADLPSGAPA